MPHWATYLAGFHDEQPGITEDILQQARYAGSTAYDWLAEVVPPDSRVLDLACGSAPIVGPLADSAGYYLGVDQSREELQLAAARGVSVVQGDAVQLPVVAGSVDVVTVSMALMLLPLAETLEEIRRVLRAGGLLVATVPADGPLSLIQRWRWGRLLLAFRRTGLPYPQDLGDLTGALSAAGMVLESDSRRGFSYPVVGVAAADRLLDSLYLPDVDPGRLAAGRRVVRGWVGREVTIPIRRVTARAARLT